jgi:2'-5' RNA ligase
MDVGIAEYWRHNRIVWAGPQDCPGALRMLVAGLEAAIGRRGFHYDQRTYAPHITLLRNARCAPKTRTITPIQWFVSGLVLVQSERRARALVYKVLRHWPLGADNRTARRVARRPQDD